MGLLIVSGIMTIWGAGILISVIFRLKFYWDSPRMIASRKLFGDKQASLVHGGVGVLMILLGLWVVLG
ncbi:MAG: hypothetical protein ACE5FD_13860 [Anaerolineae bacterium]